MTNLIAETLISFDGLGIVEAFAISALAAIVVWLALPRGVVLTKAPPGSQDGVDDYDTWLVRSETGVAIRITSVELTAIGDPIEVGRHLRFVDDALGMRREADNYSWDGVRVPPGEQLLAHVPVNHTMRIKYRRAGVFGLADRHELVVHGFV